MRELSTKEVGQVSGGFFLLKGLLYKKTSLLGGLFGGYSRGRRYGKRGYGRGRGRGCGC